MEQFKKAKVVMLPTNKKTKYLMVYSDVEKTKGKLILNGLKNDEYKEYQHLYIISDDEIKDNYYIIDNIPELLKNNGLKFIDGNCKKVIATTDTSLYTHKKETVSLPERVFYLPQPSKQFIEKYIEEYNKGNVITDVLVEYELISNEEYFGNTVNPDDDVPYFDEKLKINPKDDTITIKKVKDSYTREEHISNIKKFSLELGSKIHCFLKEDGTLSVSIQDVNKWIEENL